MTVVVSADANADSVALCALYAKAAGGVLAVGGRGAVATETASKYLKLLRNQRSAMTLVGVKATTTLRTSFLGFGTVTTQSAPAFRAVNTVLGSGNHTASVTAVTGAATYRAYDSAGVQIASSTTPTLTISGVPRPLEIRALNNAGSVLASIQYKVSEYALADDRPAAMATSSAANIHHLVFLGTSPLPRLISRTSTDPLAASGTLPTVTKVAITCLSTFTDTSQSASLEHRYDVVTLSNSPKSCGSTAANGEDKVQVSGVTMPATAFGAAAPSPRATLSRLSRAVTDASVQKRGTRATVATSPGDGWAPIYFRYGAFIPDDKVWAGGLSPDPRAGILSA